MDATPRPESYHANANDGDGADVIYVVDPLRRTLVFPFERVKTWESLAMLISQSCPLTPGIDELREQLIKAHYDILGPDNAVIIPRLWESLARPGLKVTVALWPVPSAAVPVPPPGPPPPPRKEDAAWAGLLDSDDGYQYYGVRAPPEPRFAPPPSKLVVGVRPRVRRPRPRTSSLSGSDSSASLPHAHKSAGPSKKVLSWVTGGLKPQRKKRARAPRPVSVYGPRAKGSESEYELRPSLRHAFHHAPVPSYPSPGVPRKGDGFFRPPKLRRENSVEFHFADSDTTRRIEPAIIPCSPRAEIAYALESSHSESSDSMEIRRRQFQLSDDSTDSDEDIPDPRTCIPKRASAQPRRMPGRFNTLLSEDEPLEILEFREARVYKDERRNPASSIELVECRRTENRSGAPTASEQMKWIHVSRGTLDLEELEDIALNRSTLINPGECQDAGLAIETLIDTLRERTFAKAGGVILRCNIKNRSGTGPNLSRSATFISMPFLYVDALTASPNTRGKGASSSPGIAGKVRQFIGPSVTTRDDASSSSRHKKVVLLPRRLHETFSVHDKPIDRDKKQALRMVSGQGAEDVLWVGYVWILVIEGRGILTYGCPQAEPLLRQNLLLSDLQTCCRNPAIEILDLSKKRLRVPLDSCDNFFIFRQLVEDEQSKTRRNQDLYALRLVDDCGNEINALTWSTFLHQEGSPSFRIRVRRIERAKKRKLSRRPSRQAPAPGVRTFAETPAEGQVGASTIATESAESTLDDLELDDMDVPPDVFTETDSRREYSHLELRALDPRVPPFCIWGDDPDKQLRTSLQPTMQSQNLSDDGRRECNAACLSRVAFALKTCQRFLVSQLKEEFPALDLDLLKPASGLDEVPQATRFSGRAQILATDFCAAATSTLGAFIDNESKTFPTLEHYLNSLSRLLQTSAKSTTAASNSQKWLLRRDLFRILGPEYSKGVLNLNSCTRCNRRRIYPSEEGALEHLRKRHAVKATPEHKLQSCIVALSEAAPSALESEYVATLDLCRDSMARLSELCCELQKGMVVDGVFRGPSQGVPGQLFAALELLFAYVLALPLLFDEIENHYVVGVSKPEAEYLEMPWDIRYKRVVIERVGLAARNLIKDAERSLQLSRDLKPINYGIRYFEPVSLGTLASQMISNLSQDVVYNGMTVCDIYEACCENWSSEVLNHARKLQVPAIGAFTDEVRKLKTISEWQSQLCEDLTSLPGFIPPPNDYRGRGGNGISGNPYNIQRNLIKRTQAQLEYQIELFNATLERSADLVDSVRDLTNIMRDEDNKAILLFTLITVIFLPLSFVASYLSMSDGPSSEDWDVVQGLFWKTAEPLAAGIGLFCLVVSWRGSTAQTAIEWLRVNLWGGRHGPEADEGEEKGINEIENP